MIILSIFQFHNLFLRRCNPLKVVKKIIEYLVKSDAIHGVFLQREGAHFN